MYTFEAFIGKITNVWITERETMIWDHREARLEM